MPIEHGDDNQDCMAGGTKRQIPILIPVDPGSLIPDSSNTLHWSLLTEVTNRHNNKNMLMQHTSPRIYITDNR